MEIRKWITMDVHYNEDEQDKADSYRKYAERSGYEFQQTDAGSGFHYTDQYIKSLRTKPYNDTKRT